MSIHLGVWILEQLRCSCRSDPVRTKRTPSPPASALVLRALHNITWAPGCNSGSASKYGESQRAREPREPEPESQDQEPKGQWVIGSEDHRISRRHSTGALSSTLVLAASPVMQNSITVVSVPHTQRDGADQHPYAFVGHDPWSHYGDGQCQPWR